MDRPIKQGDILENIDTGSLVLVLSVEISNPHGLRERFRYKLFYIMSMMIEERHFFHIEDSFSFVVGV